MKIIFFFLLHVFIKVKIKKLFLIYLRQIQYQIYPIFKKDFNYFKILIKNKTNIIEYGMGGSTLFLVNKNKD